MNINKFIEDFAGQLDDTPVDQLGPRTRFRDLEEWSSLIALSIISMIDEEYGVQISGAEMRESETIQDVFAKVVAKRCG